MFLKSGFVGISTHMVGRFVKKEVFKRYFDLHCFNSYFFETMGVVGDLIAAGFHLICP